MTDRPRPDGLATAGSVLWHAVTDVLDLDEHEALALRELCRTADVLDQLQAVVARDGVLLDSSQGARAHPALTELRQQRIAFARLAAAMRLPAGLADGKPSAAGDAQRGQVRSGVRGFYAIDGGSA
ncbi:MAG: terminase [Vicinamibacterales bacterium]